MAWPKLLVFVRHGESVGNLLTVEERVKSGIAPHDYALTTRGRHQALLTGLYLSKEFGSFDAYFTSYYRRSRDTMELMYPKVKVREDARLAESQRGIWHVLTEEEIRKRYPEEIRRKELDGLYHYRPPGGENWPDTESRVDSFLNMLRRDYAGKRILVGGGHGHWFVLCQRLLDEFSIEEALRRYHAGGVENASITVYEGVEIAGKSRLVLNPKYDNFIPWKGLL